MKLFSRFISFECGATLQRNRFHFDTGNMWHIIKNIKRGSCAWIVGRIGNETLGCLPSSTRIAKMHIRQNHFSTKHIHFLLPLSPSQLFCFLLDLFPMLAQSALFIPETKTAERKSLAESRPDSKLHSTKSCEDKWVVHISTKRPAKANADGKKLKTMRNENVERNWKNYCSIPSEASAGTYKLLSQQMENRKTISISVREGDGTERRAGNGIVIADVSTRRRGWISWLNISFNSTYFIGLNSRNAETNSNNTIWYLCVTHTDGLH